MLNMPLILPFILSMATALTIAPKVALPAPPTAAEQLNQARQRSENYCHEVITEGSYNPDKAVVVLIDKLSFCTYLLQLDSDNKVVSVFSTPNSVGRVGHETKAGSYRISRLVLDPVWVNPENGDSINSFSRDLNNPLGVAAITIREDTPGGAANNYINPEISMALHGTNNEKLVGKRRISASCIRHFNWAIRLMLNVLRENGRVEIVDKIDNTLSLPITDFQ